LGIFVAILKAQITYAHFFRQALGLLYGGPRHGGFQNFTIIKEVVTASIPDTLSFEKAAVIPLGISTSAVGLYEHLKLRLPPTTPTNKDSKEIVLIWGGASSMGSTAIQLVAAAGYSIITTASAKNHAYVKSLAPGSQITIFDHADSEVTSKVIAHVKTTGTEFAGAYDCIGDEKTTRACAEVIHAFGGGPLPSVLWPPNGLPEDVQAVFVNGGNPGLVPDHIGAKIWESFVPEALKNGMLQAKPDPMVVGHGLEAIQEAMEIQKRGVSARKVVVTL